MGDNQILLTMDDFEGYCKDSEDMRILRELYSKFKNPDSNIVRSILEVTFDDNSIF